MLHMFNFIQKRTQNLLADMAWQKNLTPMLISPWWIEQDAHTKRPKPHGIVLIIQGLITETFLQAAVFVAKSHGMTNIRHNEGAWSKHGHILPGCYKGFKEKAIIERKNWNQKAKGFIYLLGMFFIINVVRLSSACNMRSVSSSNCFLSGWLEPPWLRLCERFLPHA